MIERKKHKFFERYLLNDLSSLSEYLSTKHSEILSGTILDIPKNILDKYNRYNGASTQLSDYYNIFAWDSPEILNLKMSIKEMLIEAMEHYEVSIPIEEYRIKGWFNLDFASPENLDLGVSPENHPEHYHDHLGGKGSPHFHGYYCVNAEPSVTYYKINNLINVKNINKNNRAILSETGHPHGRDDWYMDSPRITIAYDLSVGDNRPLWEKL